jgi:uncharacterized protein (DUF433 family)
MERITINPDICKGKPSIRNMRFTVVQILELLASGMTAQEILDDYPYIEMADILACLQYAARMANTHSVLALSA